MTRSALALVNGQPWDMHRPLTEDCQLQFLHFKDEDPVLCNEVSTPTQSVSFFCTVTSSSFKQQGPVILSLLILCFLYSIGWLSIWWLRTFTVCRVHSFCSNFYSALKSLLFSKLWFSFCVFELVLFLI